MAQNLLLRQLGLITNQIALGRSGKTVTITLPISFDSFIVADIWYMYMLKKIARVDKRYKVSFMIIDTNHFSDLYSRA